VEYNVNKADDNMIIIMIIAKRST